MTQPDIAGRLAAYCRRRVVFTIDGDTLRWKAPRGVLTDDDRAWFREHKAVIVAALEARPLLTARDWADALPEAQELAAKGAARVAWERVDIANATPPLTQYERTYADLILDLAAALVRSPGASREAA
jgi:hypothetical protein